MTPKTKSLSHLPHVQAALCPTRFSSVVEWAKARVRLPASSPEPGPLDLRRTPYLPQIAEDIIAPKVRDITVIASRQVGKSTLQFVVVGWTIDQDPAPVQFLMGRDKDAKIMSRDRMKPIIKASPFLWEYVRSETRELQLSLIDLNGAVIYFGTAGSAAEISMKPLKIVCGDELHLWPADVEGEGDPLDIVKNALTNYTESLFLRTSTPTDDRSTIKKQFDLGDQNYFHTPCPDCGSESIWRPENIRLPEGVVEPENIRGGDLAWHECQVCGGADSNTGRTLDWQRMEMMRAARWIAKRPTPHPTHRSYRVGIHSPWRGFSEIKALEIECGEDPLQLQAWTNTVCGDDWKERVGSINIRSVDTLTGMYNTRGKVPAEARLLTAGVDWHGMVKGLYWSLWAWGSRRRAWEVDYGRVLCNKERVSEWLEDVCGQLDAVFVNREWIPEGGEKPLLPWVGADSGYKGQDPAADGGLAHQNQAYDYARSRPRTFAIRGIDRPNNEAYIGEFSSKAESKHWRGIEINTGHCKGAFATYFNHGMSLPLDAVEGESNYIQLANGTERGFMDSMASEELIVDDKGREAWQKTGSSGIWSNHGWDSAIYAYGMALKRRWAMMRDAKPPIKIDDGPAPREVGAGESGRFRRPRGHRRPR